MQPSPHTSAPPGSQGVAANAHGSAADRVYQGLTIVAMLLLLVSLL